MRRGQAAEMIPWFVRMMLLLAAVIVIALLVRTYSDREVKAEELHLNTYLYRIYYDDIIMYSDSQTQRVYPGIVDYDKVTTERLDSVFVQDKEPNIASRLVLTPAGGCSLAEKTIYNHQATFENTAPRGDLRGVGGQMVQSTVFPITIRQKSVDCAGTLNITIVRRSA